MEQVLLMGAGGKMGRRVAKKIANGGYSVDCVETDSDARKRLAADGFPVVEAESAAGAADYVVLAVPDRLIGPIASSFVSLLRPGTIVVCLDPAAPMAGELPDRGDVTYFMTHPCHPSIFNAESDPEAQRDRFGGIAKQAIVCALIQGPDSDYERGERLAVTMFAPISNSHRLTLEQVALLEPALAETVCITLLTAIREATDEAVRAGVPEAAAHDFVLGHLGVELAILFSQIDAKFSDGAIKAAQRGAAAILRPEWKNVFRMENIMEEIRAITRRD